MVYHRYLGLLLAVYVCSTLGESTMVAVNEARLAS